MSQNTGRAQASCEACGKVYRVPDPGRSYSCKACGGTVRVAAENPFAGMVTCPTCQAINAAGSRFCAECGEGVGAGAPVRSDGAVRDRRRAASELRRAFKRIRMIRWLYRLGAVSYALTTLVLVLAIGNPDMRLGTGVLLVTLFTALTILMVIGSIQIRFQPFVWTVIVASLATVSAVVGLFQSGPVSVSFLWGLMWAVLFWLAVVPTVRFRKLTAQHPDLYIVHRIHGTELERAHAHRSHEPTEERSQRILAEAGRRAWKLSALASGGILLASLLGTATVVAQVRPEDFAAKEERFRGAWNARDLNALGELYAARIREKELEWLAGVVAGNGWEQAWPRLGEATTDRFDESVLVQYDLDERSLVAEWRLVDGEWFVVELGVPLPPLDPLLERFAAAWQASDAQAIAQLFAPQSRAKLERSITRSIERRNWKEYPAILDWYSEPVSSKRVKIVFEVRGGELTTGWAFGTDGNWALISLKLP